jgi:hypothetical protein
MAHDFVEALDFHKAWMASIQPSLGDGVCGPFNRLSNHGRSTSVSPTLRQFPSNRFVKNVVLVTG